MPGLDNVSDRNSVPARLAVVAGVAAGCVLVALWAILYGLALTPFPPFDLADLFIRYSPGDVATWAIETFGRWAQRLVLASGVVVWIAAWAMHRRIGHLSGAAFGLAYLPPALALAAWSEAGLSVGRWIWLAIAFGGTLALAGLLLGRWMTRLVEIEHLRRQPASSGYWLDQPGDLGRRAFLQRMAGFAILAGFGGLLGWLLRDADVSGTATSAGTPLDQLRGQLASSPVADGAVALPTPLPAAPPSTAFVAPEAVRPRITDNADFYEVDISTRDPVIEEEEWALRVHGLVEREQVLSYTDLLALPSIDLYGTLMCISYKYGSELISTTRWTGVRLRDVLERAGVRDGVVDLACYGAGGYSDSIPLAKALEPTTLLAYGMNGEALPRSHGFPCRLYVPNIYGEKNVKWLREIEVVDHDYQGFWQERGWTDIATINTISVIDTPSGTATRDVSGLLPVGGIAFAGSRGISAVQLRIDDGPWLDVQLEPNEPPLIWQRWRYDWPAEPGTHRLTVRAVDGAGTPQIDEPRPPHPDGMTGLHSVTVNVR